MNVRQQRNSNGTVPYFVLQQRSDHEQQVDSDTNNKSLSSTSQQQSLSRAMFTVPEEFVDAIIVHPILCCGSSFILVNDDVTFPSTTTSMKQSNGTDRKTKTATNTPSKTVFISTMYDSPDPDHTAYEISQRIYLRIQNIQQHQQHEEEKGRKQLEPNGDTNSAEQKLDPTTIATKQREWARTLLL